MKHSTKIKCSCGNMQLCKKGSKCDHDSKCSRCLAKESVTDVNEPRTLKPVWKR